MRDEFVQARWAKVAVERVKSAIADWNNGHPSKMPIRIVWGWRNEEESKTEKKELKSFQQQEGLISWLDLDFKLNIRRHGDLDHPDQCTISTTFEEPQPLPLIPRDLYNVLNCCQSVILTIHPNEESDGIAVLGVQTDVAVENLTGRVLHDVLVRLLLSHKAVFERLAKKNGDDYWKFDGGAR